MKRKTISTLLAVALLFLTACGSIQNTADKTGAQNSAPITDSVNSAPLATAEPAAVPSRQDGERFEAVITLEGMEETVQYAHLVNETLGFEMDYDYERFTRISEADRELFVSVWDDDKNPENYLEVRYNTASAALAADAVSAILSQDFDLIRETRELDRAGSCIYIEASELKGTGRMADELQAVYIIPASVGCRVAAAHFSIEAAEGFARRFHYMLDTLSVIEKDGPRSLTDEEALSAVRNYCLSSNPELERHVESEDYPVYWEIVSSDESEVVVLFRSYTGAQLRYYIDRVMGSANVTEFVPGIMDEEQATAERFFAWDYLD